MTEEAKALFDEVLAEARQQAEAARKLWVRNYALCCEKRRANYKPRGEFKAEKSAIIAAMPVRAMRMLLVQGANDAWQKKCLLEWADQEFSKLSVIFYRDVIQEWEWYIGLHGWQANWNRRKLGSLLRTFLRRIN